MSSMNSMRLRELIRSVRQCKTAGDERALINRECANIRQGFKENTPYLRTRNMLKLLYIHMLGYPTEFGQLEVVNLISQNDFAGKRIGYLSLQLLLDENDEVLTLSENRMKCDMGSGNPLVQAVALHAAANVASEDMSRDIFEEVMKLVGSHNPYIRKKACLAALRIVHKVPEHAEYFLESFTDLFSETHASSLLCALTLINACLTTSAGAAFMGRYRKLATAAVRVLKSLVLSSRVTESDVGGITDPFLQVKLLQFMRIIGAGSAVTSEALNDVLAQVITNTDATRNVGCAVHYECVRTIDGIESDEGLRTLAMNTIGRFVASSHDNNLRFVALQTLLESARRNALAVQQHQGVIVECLKDVDVSIRRRALDLTVRLVTPDNVRLLVPDLLTYLSLCAEEIRDDVTSRICAVIEEKSPSVEWRVDLSLKLLKLSRSYAPTGFAKRLIALLSCQPLEVCRAVTTTLWSEATCAFDAIQQSRTPLLLVVLWMVGEYATELIKDGVADANTIADALGNITCNSLLPLIKQYGLNALMKLASRVPEAREAALKTIRSFTNSSHCELQQRAREYSVMLTSFPEEAAHCFGPMMPICHPSAGDQLHPVPVMTQHMLEQQTTTALDNLFDVGASSAATAGAAVAVGPAAPMSVVDSLFGDAPVAAQPPPAAEAHDPIAELFSAGGAQRSPAPVRAAVPENEVFTCADFSVLLSGTQFRAGVIVTNLIVRSKAAYPMENVSCLLATLKTCTLVSSPLSAHVVPPYGEAAVSVEVDTSAETQFQNQLKLRVVLSYAVNGESREQHINVTSHPN